MTIVDVFILAIVLLASYRIGQPIIAKIEQKKRANR